MSCPQLDVPDLPRRARLFQGWTPPDLLMEVALQA